MSAGAKHAAKIDRSAVDPPAEAARGTAAVGEAISRLATAHLQNEAAGRSPAGRLIGWLGAAAFSLAVWVAVLSALWR